MTIRPPALSRDRSTTPSAAPSELDLGRRVLRLPWPGGGARADLRAVVVSVACLVLAALVALVSVGTGDYVLSPAQVLQALLGLDAPAGDVFVVRELRLPRTVMALALGAALAMGGAVFQTLTRNPLGSPDIIGFGTGAYTGALIVMLVLGGGYLMTSAGALVGGAVTAILVYALSVGRAIGRSGVAGFRLIVIGIGVSAMLSAVNTWLILRAEVEDALQAAVWGAGSLNGMAWAQAVPAVIVCVVLLALTALLWPRMHVLELGDDSAASLGLRVEPTRLALMLLGIASVAVVSATAGPISFIALAAPQIARRLTRGAGIPLGTSAMVGALLLLLSDLVAQRIRPDSPLPVGVVTVSVGGLYLIWLLISEGRKARR